MVEPSPVGVLGVYLASPSGPRSQTIQATQTWTNRAWAERVLEYLNAMMPVPSAAIPLTTNNINNILLWNQAENGIPQDHWWGNPTTANPNRSNPLNNGEGPPNGNPLGSYTDLDQAAYYLARLLLFGPSWANYRPIVTALQNDASAADFSAAVVQSSFEGTRYGVKTAIDAYNAKNPPMPIPASAVVAGRGLNYLATLTVPPETFAPPSQGSNPSDTNGVGWDWASPQSWQPNPGTSFPGAPDPLPVTPNLVPINPSDPATYNATTGFGQVPPTASSGGLGGPGGGQGPATGPSGGTTSNGGNGGGPVDVTGTSNPGSSEPGESDSPSC